MINNIIVICCALAVPVVAVATEPAQPGMTVVRDPLTGRLRAPTAAELRALRKEVVQPQMNATPAPKATVRADGTRSIDLGERGMVYSVMHRNDDGTLAGYCVNGEHAAAKAIEKKQEIPHEHR